MNATPHNQPSNPWSLPDCLGAQVVHKWCTSGAQVVHKWCTSGAQVVHKGSSQLSQLLNFSYFSTFPCRNLKYLSNHFETRNNETVMIYPRNSISAMKKPMKPFWRVAWPRTESSLCPEFSKCEIWRNQSRRPFANASTLLLHGLCAERGLKCSKAGGSKRIYTPLSCKIKSKDWSLTEAEINNGSTNSLGISWYINDA